MSAETTNEPPNHTKAILRCLIDSRNEQLLITITNEPLQTQLNKLYEAIHSQWNYTFEQVIITINNISIAPNESDKLKQILSQIPTDKAVFNVTKIETTNNQKQQQQQQQPKTTAESKQNDFYAVKIHFNEKVLTTKLSKMTDQWDNELFNKFQTGIKSYLKLNENIYMYEQSNNDNKIVINNIENLKK
eukprot:383737_1